MDATARECWTVTKRKPDVYKQCMTAVGSSGVTVCKAGVFGHRGTAFEEPRYPGHVQLGGDDDEGEEADDCDSEASSDMEANLFDVEQEEETSTCSARKGDAEELACLDEHDRQKRKRKTMLEMMAAEKRKKRVQSHQLEDRGGGALVKTRYGDTMASEIHWLMLPSKPKSGSGPNAHDEAMSMQLSS